MFFTYFCVLLQVEIISINNHNESISLQGIEADDLESSGVREFVMNYNENDETTGISILISQSSILNSEGWYDISGRKMINGKWKMAKW